MAKNKLICKQCRKEFKVSPCRINKAKYCSPACRFASQRGKPAYWLSSPQAVAIKKKISRAKMGNKGRTGIPHTEETKAKIGKSNSKERLGYGGLHDFIRRNKGKPKRCEYCGAENNRIGWANLDYKYTRNFEDYIALCASCHYKFDQKKKEWGTATKMEYYG